MKFCTKCGETNHSEFVLRYWDGLCAKCDEIANPPECWDEKCQKRHADAAHEIQRLQDEVERLSENLRLANESCGEWADLHEACLAEIRDLMDEWDEWAVETGKMGHRQTALAVVGKSSMLRAILEKYDETESRPMADLKPCPFCGSMDLQIQARDINIGHGSSDTEHSVHCYECGISACKWIPYGMSYEVAVEAWNRRANEKEQNETD